MQSLVSSGVSIPTITLALSQFIAQNPITIQLTDAQAAIIENTNNNFIVADGSVLGEAYPPSVMMNIQSSESTHRILTVVTPYYGTSSRIVHGCKNFSIIYDSTNKTGVLTTIKLSTDTVSVSSTGTATDEISYITINGTEKKIAGGSIPSITITEDQINEDETITFTASQKAIIENTNNSLVKIIDFPDVGTAVWNIRRDGENIYLNYCDAYGEAVCSIDYISNGVSQYYYDELVFEDYIDQILEDAETSLTSKQEKLYIEPSNYTDPFADDESNGCNYYDEVGNIYIYNIDISDEEE